MALRSDTGFTGFVKSSKNSRIYLDGIQTTTMIQFKHRNGSKHNTLRLRVRPQNLCLGPSFDRVTVGSTNSSIPAYCKIYFRQCRLFKAPTPGLVTVPFVNLLDPSHQLLSYRTGSWNYIYIHSLLTRR